MSQYSYKDYIPEIEEKVYLAPGCKIIGRCTLRKAANVWHNTVIRADVNKIDIGENTNVQDLSMLHVTEQNPLIIGKNVTIGHKVTLHACSIGDFSLIGMGAVVLDGAQIGNYCIVAAGSVVTPNKKFPERSMIMGSPAKVVRELKDEEVEMLNKHYKSYLSYAQDFNNERIVKEITS